MLVGVHLEAWDIAAIHRQVFDPANDPLGPSVAVKEILTGADPRPSNRHRLLLASDSGIEVSPPCATRRSKSANRR